MSIHKGANVKGRSGNGTINLSLEQALFCKLLHVNYWTKWASTEAFGAYCCSHTQVEEEVGLVPVSDFSLH